MPPKRQNIGRLTNDAKRSKVKRIKQRMENYNEMKETEYVNNSQVVLNHRNNMKHKMKMALTPAEKQRRYREKLKKNPEKYTEVKKKDKERKKVTREKIVDLSSREQRYQRKYWRKKQSECRRRKTSLATETPEGPSSSTASASVNKIKGRKKINRSRSKIVRDNLKLQENNEKLQRKLEIDGQYSQDSQVTSIASVSTGKRKIQYPSEGKQEFFGFSKSATNKNIALIIKTEILDPSEQNQELILPDYPEHVTTIDPMSVVKTEILDSPKINTKPLLSNIKMEHIQIDTSVDELSRIEKYSESNINNENSRALKYKLTKCFVLLHDCLIPENLASISANFKSIKINTDVSEFCPKVELLPLRDSPFFCHISETYKNLELSGTNKKISFRGPYKKIISSKKMKEPIHYSRVCPDITKKKKARSNKSKYICNCFKAPEDMITIKSELDENNLESTQQLCSCLTSDFTMKPAEIRMKDISLLDPDFGKISCGLNKMDWNF